MNPSCFAMNDKVPYSGDVRSGNTNHIHHNDGKKSKDSNPKATCLHVQHFRSFRNMHCTPT